MSKKLTQRASGQITLCVVKGTEHCSISEPNIDVTYDLKFTFTEDALDERGFLIDATAFKLYFDALSELPISVSCETLAKNISSDFLSMIGDRGKWCLKSEVTLSPFNGVSITYEEERNHILSEFSS